MPVSNHTINTLNDLLNDNAAGFPLAEAALQKSLDKWILAAQSVKLKSVLQKYKDQVIQHIQKMEKYAEEENINSLPATNRIMKSFIEETEEKLNKCGDAETKDACLLACVQAINHYKISMYGTAAAFANTVSLEKYAAVFHEAEINEKQIDDRLTQLADFEVNLKAKAPIVLPG